jgi:hypothetical protein
MEANLVYLAWVVGLTVAGFIGLRSVTRAYRGVAAFLNLDEASWWRTTLPWPHGVQEDDEVHFHVEAIPLARASADAGDPPDGSVEDITGGRTAMKLSRPDGHIRIR